MAKVYKIKNFRNDEVTPEETFFDSIQNHSSLETPLRTGVIFFMRFVLIGIFIIFVIKAFQLQIVEGSSFAQKINRDLSSSLASFSLRGVIYDTRNRQLVENLPSLQLIVVPSEIKFASESDKWSRVADLINITKQDLAERLEHGKSEPNFLLKKNIENNNALIIKNLEISGLYLVVDAQRNYLFDEQIAHILGYTGKVNQKDIQEDDFYYINDRIGRAGLESYYEDYLRGEHSQLIFNNKNEISNSKNDISSNTDKTAISSQDIKTGNHLVLTLDLDVQQKLFQIIESIFKTNNIKRGGVVAQKVSTGEILGMVSLPSYDPNAFQGLSKDTNYVEDLFNDKNRPLFNRMISGLYVPGSTIKPLYALAVLREGIISPEKLIYSAGSITVSSIYDSSVKYTFKDWKKHGWTDVRKAISDSVDVYFYAVCGGLSGPGYETIKGLGIEKMVEYLNLFLLDKKLGIDLPAESSGFIPTPEWKIENKKEPWLIGDTYNASIGQGDLLVTPLWLNTYISALANGGLIMKPFLVRQIIDNRGQQVASIQSKVIKDLSISDNNLKIVLSGMRQTVTDGTAKRLNSLPVKVAGKTGTAQVSSGKKLNSLFSAYAPYDNPEIAITVIVEDIPADTQSLAVEIANQFLYWYFTSYKQVEI